MLRFILIILLSAGGLSAVRGQDTVRLGLEEAVRLGHANSVDAVVVKNEYISAYWGYRTYKTELLPEVILNGTVPYYSKSYNRYQKEDGTYDYVSQNFNRIDGGLSITQNIPWTGGKLSLESSVERLHQYGDKSSTRYKSIPGAITLEQPVFGFNRVKWLQRIEPVKYKEAQQQLITDREEVTLMVIQYYFDLLIGQANLEIAEQNRANAERLYTIAEARRRIGQMSEVELMQMKNSLLQAQASLADVRMSLDSRMFQLRSYLGLGEDIVIEPVIPEFLTDNIPVLNYAEVLELAHANNSFTQNIQRRMLEASRDVSQAKADRWNITLFASFGMSGQEDTFQQAFNNHNLRGDQTINVGIRIPILDWGKGKGKVRVAEANREVVASRIEKEKMDFNQDIFLRVQKFNNQPRQLMLAKEMDEIARARYNTTVEAFVQDKMDILNLNDSQSSKDTARRNYIQQMFLLWSYYYQIRALTLHDFILDRPLETEYPI